MKKIRSPFFYVGDKYKIMDQLLELFPKKINNYYEPFVGGGSSFLNVINAEKYILNDINYNVIELHKMLSRYGENPEKFYKKIFGIIEKYELSCSYLGRHVPIEIRKKYIKTYYSKYNKENYLKLREEFNLKNKVEILYILLIYGFNHMIRFNKNGKFNLPVGNIDFNNNVHNALEYYFEFIKERQIEFNVGTYEEFIKKIEFKNNDFIYLDPPYLISSSEYNKLWSSEEEEKLYYLLDELNKKGVKFAISNLLEHKGRKNKILNNWMSKYNVYEISSNYISRFDNSIKKDSREVCVTNYGKQR